MGNTSATTSTRSIQRSGGQVRKGRTTRGISWRGRGRANKGNIKNPVADGKSQPNEESKLAEQNKKGQNRDMNPQKRLVFIWKCIEHTNEYKPRIKDVF